MKIERVFNARRLNEIVNDPDVYRWVKGYALDKLDLAGPSASPHNCVLIGDGGAIIFVGLQPGLYEAHTQVLKSHRGAWAKEFCQECLRYLFTHTDAMEVMTRCPTVPSKALARALGFTRLFTNPKGWVIDNDPVPADIYSLMFQNWAPNAPGLEARGKWFHDRLEEELKKFNQQDIVHAPDLTHDRYVGIAVEMALAGLVRKGAVLYNRWAALADYKPITVVSDNPPVVDIGTALLRFSSEDFEVIGCPSVQSSDQPS